MKEEYDPVSDIKKETFTQKRKERERFIVNYKRGIYKEMHRRDFITEEQLEQLLQNVNGR